MPTVRMPVEVDITYVNKTWFSLRKKSTIKRYVIGFFQRDGQAIIEVLPNNDYETIKSVVAKRVQAGSIIYSEKNILPIDMKDTYEIAEFDPVSRVKGEIHVNNVKNMWRDLKRDIKRVHVSVSEKHLQLYCDEVVYRVNTRHLSPKEKFDQLLQLSVQTGVKRTYKDIIK